MTNTTSANINSPRFRALGAASIYRRYSNSRPEIQKRIEKMRVSAMIDCCFVDSINVRQSLVKSGVKKSSLFHKSKNFQGNVGFMIAILNNPSFYLSSGVGASKSLSSLIDDKLQKINNGRLSGTANRVFQTIERPVEPVYHAQPDRQDDSEYLLINDFVVQINQNKHSEGVVILLTERLPCCSCEKIIIEFCSDYPKIKLVVCYWTLNGRSQSDADQIEKQMSIPNSGNMLVQINSVTGIGKKQYKNTSQNQ